MEPKIALLELDVVIVRESLQIREDMDTSAISDYCRLLEDDPEFNFPPITVFHTIKNRRLLADGFHRLEAYKLSGRTEIPAEIHKGEYRQAFLYALRANTMYGVRLTNADKRKRIRLVLEDQELRLLSNSEIGRRYGVTGAFVGQMRQTLEEEGEIPAVNNRGGKLLREERRALVAAPEEVSGTTPVSTKEVITRKEPLSTLWTKAEEETIKTTILQLLHKASRTEGCQWVLKDLQSLVPILQKA